MIRVSLFLSGRLVSKTGFDRPEVVIGRDPSSDIVIDNLGISRHHARIFRSEEGWLVEDLNSQNGVYVCGSRVKRHPLLSDDEFTISKYTVKFEELSPMPAVTAPAVETVAAPEASPLPLSDAYADRTFALDRGDLQKIIERARTGEPTKTAAAKLTRVRPKRPPLAVNLSRNHYMAGTAKNCDIRLRGWFTPKRAALFVQEGGRDMVISLTDSSRVKVNGQKVDSKSLADGDTIQIGKNVLVYTR
jgi:pSer/pThr/pTyr-binding forkhead associated (FHA) protein